MTNLRDLEFNELSALTERMGEKSFRAKQLSLWLHQRPVASFEEMSTLPKEFRTRLSEEYSVYLPEAVQVLTSKIDGTKKFIFRLEDGNVIESVWMKYEHGNSVCISTQVGCRMGCRFCASTIDGLARSLSSGEMLSEVYQIARITGEPVSNIVLMGSGEPLDNYDNVTRFLRMISDERGFHISRRNITLSTCGIAPMILKLADEDYGVTLSLSLHAPDDEVRRKLMPIANRYSLSEVLPAVKYYFQKTGRRVTFEYSVVSGVNDNREEAEELASLITGLRKGGDFQCHVNLIPVNPIRERDFVRPDRKKILDFQHILERHGITTTIRREMGADISGACGQLRRNFLDK